MPKDTPSMTKNKIKRALGAILDPPPAENEKPLIWEYFENTCAYCGLVMERKSRTGHLDHVVSTADGAGTTLFTIMCFLVGNAMGIKYVKWNGFNF